MTSHTLSKNVPQRVDREGRYLIDSAGRRCFPLADTAWELFHRLTPDEADHYLRVRAAQGFNAIQAVLLAEIDGVNEPAVIGEKPLHDHDPARPNDRYFDHVDRIVARMNRLGMIAVLLPTWGDKVTRAWGIGPAVFNSDNAHAYGRYLGERYARHQVLWMIGGDRPVQTETEKNIWRRMALGIREADPRHLMTFHPNGGQSSRAYVHDERWLDFNTIQTGHAGRNVPIEKMVLTDLAHLPPKPTLNSEPCYEAHPVMRKDYGCRPRGGYFDDGDVRDAAWRSMFCGACGHTYGCHGVWQMYDPQRPRMNQPVNFPLAAWREQLDLPGAAQMRHVRDFFLSEPDWKPLADSAAQSLPAMKTPDGRRRAMYILAGLPAAYRAAQIHRFMEAGPVSAATWFDPRSGAWSDVDQHNQTATPDPALDWGLDLRS